MNCSATIPAPHNVDAAPAPSAGPGLPAQLAALEAAANGIVITDRQGRIEWVNPAFTEITGYSAEEAIGHTPRLLRSGQHEPAFYENLWRTILGGAVWRGEMVNRRKDGSTYHEEQSITPVRNANGAIGHFIAIKQDVSARKQAEAALAAREAHFRALIENAGDHHHRAGPRRGDPLREPIAPDRAGV